MNNKYSLKNNVVMPLAGLALLATVGGCSVIEKRDQDYDSALGDFTVSQSNYVQKLITGKTCETSKVGDYKGLLGDVKEYFHSLIDNGATICEITGGVSPSAYEKGLVTVMELAKANKDYECKISAFDNKGDELLSKNSSYQARLRSTQQFIDFHSNYMPGLATQVRNCVIKEDANHTLFIAKKADFTSATVWASFLSFGAGKAVGKTDVVPDSICTPGASVSTTLVGIAVGALSGNNGTNAAVGGNTPSSFNGTSGVCKK